MFNCSCKCDIAATTEENGLILISATKNTGDVLGLYESDEVARGIRFCTGVTWFMNNRYLKAFIKLSEDDSLIYLVELDAVEFFDSTAINQGNVALLNVMQIDDTRFIIAGAAYIGNGTFLYVSKIGDWRGLLYDNNMFIPEYYKMFNKDNIIKEIETDENAPRNLVTLTKVKVKALKDGRLKLYEVFENDLVGLKILPKSIGIVDCYSPSIEQKYYIDDKGNLYDRDLNNIASIDIACLDWSNIFSNYLFAYWPNSQSRSRCLEKIVIIKDEANELKNRFVFFYSNVYIAASTVCRGVTSYTNRSGKVEDYNELIEDVEYAFKTRAIGKGFLQINLNNNLFQYNQFIVPPLPAGTLAHQDADINSITGFSKYMIYHSPGEVNNKL